MTDPGERVLKGIPVSAGVCHGKAFLLRRAEVSIPQHEVPESEVPNQIHRFEQALIATRQEILDVQKQVTNALGAKDASIFEAHLLVIEDPTLIEQVTTMIQQKRITAESAFHQFAEKYTATLAAIDDDYLRERAADMRDVTARVLNNLLGHPQQELANLAEPCVLVAEDIPPSLVATLDKTKVLGFATDAGSKTSHTAIMARSLEIPAVVGLQDAADKIQNGDHILVDGYNGVLVINPTDQTLFEYGQLVRRHVTMEEKLKDIQGLPAVTLDGTKIALAANIEQTSDVDAVKFYGAEGVGLFRTEYLFINRDTLPTEEEQYVAYRKVAAELKPNSVIIRTLDLGGDKFLSHLALPQEVNPFLGWRAIRFCLEEKDIFRAQLRAILRASAEGNIKMMYPMVTCVDEVLKANAFVEEYKEELRKEGKPFDEKLEIGIMVEIPSAALAAATLAKHVKFFSIGTNDLIQYSLAVDRLNEKIAHLYEPTHPAILRLIKMTADAAKKQGIWCGVCGEMAGDPMLTPLLLGLGVEELSASPPVLPWVKLLIRRLKIADAKELAEFALNCDSGREILERSQALAQSVAPGMFDHSLKV